MDEFNLASVRNQRDQLLKQSDWTQIPDSALTAEQKAAWAEYRQQLRDLPGNIPEDVEDWFDVTFPVKPLT